MTVTELIVLALILWGIREAIVGYLVERQNRKLRQLIRTERTQQQFAEARNDLMRLALSGGIDTQSSTFRTLYHMNTAVMRRPDVYPEISAGLFKVVLHTAAMESTSPVEEESATWSPAVKDVVKKTADAMNYIILEYSRLFRFIYRVERMKDPTVTPFVLLVRIAKRIQEKKEKRDPILCEIRETQRKMYRMSGANC